MVPAGPIGVATARELAAFLARTRAAERRLAARRVPWPDRFPAKVTDVDRSYDPPRYAWAEQTYDEAGARIDKPGGRSGTAAHSPAFAYGDAIAEIQEYPHPTTLTRRGVATDPATGEDLGPVYEFPLYCACVSGAAGSGHGSAPGYTLVPCCPNPVPRTLTATFTSSPACACWNNIGPLILRNAGGGSVTWDIASPFVACTSTTVTAFSLTCGSLFGPGNWGFVIAASGACVLSSGVGVGTCDPFLQTVIITLSGCGECAGSTLYVVVTE